MKRKFLFILFICVIIVPNVSATSGALRKNSIKKCHNGITYGYHGSNGKIHWHQAKADSDVSSGWTSVGEAIYTDPCDFDNAGSSNNSNNNFDNITNNESDVNNNLDNNSTNNNVGNSGDNNGNNIIIPESPSVEEIKSSDNTLKKIIIDNKTYEYFENIVYVTYAENVNINVFTNDAKASYKILGGDFLAIGENRISIVVTAENMTNKTYNILIKRQKLSSEVGINITINDEKVLFENYKSTIYVDSSVAKVNIDYTLNNENATAEMEKIDELQFGDNILKVKVIAEDGSIQYYEIIIHRYSKTEDIMFTTLGLGVLCGSGYGIYKIFKRKNGKKNLVNNKS